MIRDTFVRNPLFPMAGVLCAFWITATSLVADSTDAESLPIIKFTYSPAHGLGQEKGVCRRDPSDVIKVGDTYYVWYSKVLDEPGAFKYPHGYSATIWYATSKDGHHWEEQGEALGKGGPGAWDEEGVYTPGILVADGKYYLGYDGADKPWSDVSPASEGLAISDSPDGPWTRHPDNPLNRPTQPRYPFDHPRNFDSFRVCDVSLIVRDGKYWWYYKGRGHDRTPAQTMMGVAIADDPAGPYIKHAENPVVQGGHEVLVWPHGKGVAALIGWVGKDGVNRTIQYAPDGINFRAVAHVPNPPGAPGGYRPDAFTDIEDAEPMSWGLGMSHPDRGDPYLYRFDCDLSGLDLGD